LRTESVLISESRHDPHHSRPLEVHRWSDHPEVRNLTDEIWDAYFAAEFGRTGRGKRPKTHPKLQLRVLLLDLYVAWVDDPTLSIGVAMNHTAYDAGSRYNAVHISPIICKLIRHAVAVGLIGFWRGSEGAGMVSRIWAEAPLVEAFKRARFGVLDIGRFPDEECIILSRGKGQWIPYDDTAEIVEQRSRLRAYNKLLHRTFIDIPSLDRPMVELKSEAGDEKPSVVRIDQNDKFVRRIYYRGTWDFGGRFHGGFWQRLPGDWRKRIYIDDRPVCEDDYKGMHLALLYGLAGYRCPGDPYQLDELASDFAPEEMRKWIKSLVLVSINARDEKTAFLAFRSDQPTGSPAKHFTDKTLKVMLDEFRRVHPLIADRLCSDAGVDLMAVDGRIAARVIDHFTARDVPVLTIHDSFLCNIQHAAELRSVMLAALKDEVPAAFTAIDRTGRGFDQLPAKAFGQPMGLKASRAYLGYVPECEGYCYRRDQFEEWLKTQ
jgi:hypothetical protein